MSAATEMWAKRCAELTTENERMRDALLSVRAEVNLSKAPKLMAKIEAALGIVPQQSKS